MEVAAPALRPTELRLKLSARGLSWLYDVCEQSPLFYQMSVAAKADKSGVRRVRLTVYAADLDYWRMICDLARTTP